MYTMQKGGITAEIAENAEINRRFTIERTLSAGSSRCTSIHKVRSIYISPLISRCSGKISGRSIIPA
jgi:hypothetical protein